MRTKWFARPAVGLAVLAAVGGCGGGPPPPADPAAGVAVLRAALEAWQAGEGPAALKDRSPAVVAVDPAWTAGTKLVRFEIDEAGTQPTGYDLSCPAKLWLGDGTRPPVRVRYSVALSPNKVITREFGG